MERSVCSQERGEEKGNLHLQCVGSFGLLRTFETPVKLNAAMREHMRDNAGIATKDRIKLVIKQLEGAQTFDGEGDVAVHGYVSAVTRWG